MRPADDSLDTLFEEHRTQVSSGRAWLVTFTDLVSLMLTFFVMLFAMSSVQLDRWEEILETLTRSETPAEVPAVTAPKAHYNISTAFRRRSMALEYLEAVLVEKQAVDPVLGESRIKLAADRLVVSLPGDLLFDQGSALLSESAKTALFTLGGVLRNIENPVSVAGHSDRSAPDSAKYASNWELSLGRAVSVANALRRAGYGDDIIAMGYGDSHYGLLPKDLAQNDRDLLARRVDIFILSSSGG